MIETDIRVPQFVWVQTPHLRDPFLICGFHGWSNAGNVSSDTLQHFRDTLQTRVMATLSDEPFVNYTLDRPTAVIEEGVIRHLDSMAAELAYWINPDGDRDLVLLLGKEPHCYWMTYVRMILDVIQRFGIRKLFTIGGVQDTISHSAPTVVSVVGSSPYAVTSVQHLEPGVRPAEYQGPISIHSCLIKACLDVGVEAVSLWGHVPAYLQESPRLVTKIVSILNRATGMDCPVDGLRQKSREMDRKINEALARDPRLRQFVESIGGNETGKPQSSDDEKVIHLNDFLRRDPRKDPEP